MKDSDSINSSYEEYLALPRCVFGPTKPDSVGPNFNPGNPNSVHTPKLTTTPVGDVYEFLYVARTTRKAMFFITNSGIAGEFGFWCPRSAIIEETQDHVTVAKWVDIKNIQFIE